MRECEAQRICGDPEQADERPIHLQYEKQGAANRHGAEKRTVTTVAFRVANNPKLANVIISQNSMTTRNNTGTDASSLPADTSHLASSSFSATSSAWA